MLKENLFQQSTLFSPACNDVLAGVGVPLVPTLASLVSMV